jgi:hypothetical protein
MLVQALDLVCQNIAITGTPHKKSSVAPDGRRLPGNIRRLNHQMESLSGSLLLVFLGGQSLAVHDP